MSKPSDKVIRFIESLTLSGDYAGKKFILRDWQKEILYKLFDTLNEDGTRQYREAGIWLPRKNAKTQLASGIACFFLYCDPKQLEVYSAGSDREQAGIVFQKIQGMVEANPHLMKLSKIIAHQKRIINKKTGSIFASQPRAPSHCLSASRRRVSTSRSHWSGSFTTTLAKFVTGSLKTRLTCR